MASSTSVRIEWYASRIKLYTEVAPQQAHAKAAAEAAGVAADRIQSTYTGSLAREVSTPKPKGPLETEVGSRVHRYARMEQQGGVITPKRFPRLYIRGRGVGSGGTIAPVFPLRRSSQKGDVAAFNPRTGQITGGHIVATATSVQHRGKGYLDYALRAYLILAPHYLKAILKSA